MNSCGHHKTSVLPLPVLNIPFSGRRKEKDVGDYWELGIEPIGNGPGEGAIAVEQEIDNATDGNP